MELVALAAFTDNYIWMLSEERHCIVVDPGDARPVLAALAREQLQLDAILVTHHHTDHVAGVQELREKTGAQVFGPMGEPIPTPYKRIRGREQIMLLGKNFYVMDTYGHTAGHISYYCDPGQSRAPMLFCGDTLFSAGCGRLFEGSAADMCDALRRFAALPPQTRVCCAHEYTLANLAFAKAVEPGNAAIDAYTAHCAERRRHSLPTLPSTIRQELAVNPFLRLAQPEVQAAALRHNPQACDTVSMFTALREWKNQF